MRYLYGHVCALLSYYVSVRMVLVEVRSNIRLLPAVYAISNEERGHQQAAVHTETTILALDVLG